MQDRHPQETLDVVDEHNQVIGQASRQEIHNKHLLHRAVHLILVSPNRHFLLQKRAASRPTYPGRWDSSVSGHVQAGASFEETVYREAHEEIGFEQAAPIPLLLIEGSPDTDQEWIQFYVQEVTTPPAVHSHSPEIEDLQWWPEQKLVDALVNQPDQFTPAFSILFFLWRQMNFLVPTPLPDGWYLIVEESSDRVEVQRAFLESAGLRARVCGKDSWVDPRGGKPLFNLRQAPKREGLCVPLFELPEAVALLFLSEPLEEHPEGE
jgi:isopentenyl-diphosphate Delta-isomerase